MFPEDLRAGHEEGYSFGVREGTLGAFRSALGAKDQP